MTCEVYLLVNRDGTKTKQWIIVANGRAFPEVLTNLEVAVRMAWLIAKGTSMNSDIGDKSRKKAWEDAERALVSEVAPSLSVPKCPEGRWWNGMEDIGFNACVRCPHLKEDKDRLRGRSTVQDFSVPTEHLWECGKVIQEVKVARRLADR